MDVAPLLHQTPCPGFGDKTGLVAVPAGVTWRCHRRPAGRRELGMVSTARATSWARGGRARQAEVTRGHRPSAAAVSRPSQLQQRIQPRSCRSFPQKRAQAAQGQGPQSLRSAKPAEGRGHGGDNEVLPRLPGARAPRGDRGWRCPPCRERGRRDLFGQEQPTCHPRPPVTNPGRRAGKAQLSRGFVSRVVAGLVPPRAVAA